MSLLLFSSPRFADHLTPPGHPERVERAEVLEGVAARWKASGGEVREPRAATTEELLRVHTEAYVASIDATKGRATMMDPDTFTSPSTAEVARLAAGAVLAGVDAVLAGQGAPRAALALVRPPGHHAESARAMGFCFYSSVAVAAAHARARGVERVAIVDYDVHHGNGTQEIFYRDPSVLFVSTHQYPFYPGTGAARETGKGDGVGFTVNLPLDAGATDGDYGEVFDAVVLPVLEQFAPQLLLVSAGFDAHEDDPLGQMRLSTAGYRALTARLAAAADRRHVPMVFATEGGYALPALAMCLDAVVDVLAGRPAPLADDTVRLATGRGARAITAVRTAQAGRWAGL